MHHHSTKQRLAALRRRLGIQLTPAKPSAERTGVRREAVAAVKAAHDEASAAMRAAREASRRIVAALTPAPGFDPTPAPIRELVAALTPAPSLELAPAPLLATAGGPETAPDAPTTVAPAPYPSQHLSEADAGRGRSGGRRLGLGLLLVLSLGLLGFGLYGLRGDHEPTSTPPPAAAKAIEPAPVAAPAPVVAPAPAATPAPAVAAALAPAPRALAQRQLTVAKGDCLWRLAAAHLGDPEAWPRLFAANRATIQDPDLILPGQTLELP